MQTLTRATIIILILAISACANPKRDKSFEVSIKNMEKLIRWSEFEGAMNMIDPEYLAKNPITQLDVERLKQFRVTGYTVTQHEMNAENTLYRQQVLLQMYNTHNPVERSTRWNQEWRYNAETNRWTMFSGLPDLNQP